MPTRVANSRLRQKSDSRLRQQSDSPTVRQFRQLRQLRQSDSPTVSDSVQQCPTAVRQSGWQTNALTVRQSDSCPTVVRQLSDSWSDSNLRQCPTASDSPTVCPTVPTVPTQPGLSAYCDQNGSVLPFCRFEPSGTLPFCRSAVLSPLGPCRFAVLPF